MNYEDISILEVLKRWGQTDICYCVNPMLTAFEKKVDYMYLIDVVCCRTGEVYNFICINDTPLAIPADHKALTAITENIIINFESKS